MSALLGVVLLQGDAAQPSPFGILFPMAAIFLIFYMLLIRPQNKRQREHQDMLKALGKGDRVVTSGGIHGTVTGTTDDVLTVEIANLRGERLRVKVDRARIERLIEKSTSEEKS